MAEGSLSSFAAIKPIYVKINGYPLENKEDNRCFYGKCLLYLRYHMSTKITYKSYNQNDNLLFPPSLGELIPENHPVRTVSAIIDRLDISGIESTYMGGGTSSYHPRMLLKIIVYSYMCNVYSGRRMERLLHENVNYMWLSGMSRPDFRTINRFRSERLCDGRFEELFRQTVRSST